MEHVNLLVKSALLNSIMPLFLQLKSQEMRRKKMMGGGGGVGKGGESK